MTPPAGAPYRHIPRREHVLMALESTALLHRVAPDVTRRLELYPDVTARTCHDLIMAGASLADAGATDRDVAVFMRRTTAQIVEHLGTLAGQHKHRDADGRICRHEVADGLVRAVPCYPDGLRIASYTGPPLGARQRATIETATPAQASAAAAATREQRARARARARGRRRR